MVLFYDPLCAGYGSTARPEKPDRVLKSVPQLRAAHPEWEWRLPMPADEELILLAHTPVHLKRLQTPGDIDNDTPWYENIYFHAQRSAGGALDAMAVALEGGGAFSLMRPPGHHATAGQAMGFCYLNSIAVAALAARARGVGKIAVWDFDAHHGNGTEAILDDRDGFLFCSVHQFPGYPGTGTRNSKTCRNWAVPPHAPREQHMEALAQSWEQVLAFEPELLLVSAGFDAYTRDPLTMMSLEREDFAALGSWVGAACIPAAHVLEGGYSDDLPLLIDAYLTHACLQPATAASRSVATKPLGERFAN